MNIISMEGLFDTSVETTSGSELSHDIQLLIKQEPNTAVYYSRQLEPNPESDELRTLLSTWNMEKVADHLIAENVFVNVLKIMKRYHIQKLLKDFDFGTQILFEHCLEQWRFSIGFPLRPSEVNYRSSSPTLSSSSFTSKVLESELQHNSDKDPSEDSNEIQTISLSDILNDTQKGKILVNYYKKSKVFTDVQRKLLITCVAEYFLERSLKMSLAASYRLEGEILERFPTEKIEFYRTSKRGKLYNKCANNKTFKLDTKTPKKKIEKPKRQFAPEDDAETCIRSMKFDKMSVDELDACWKACIEHRMHEIKHILKSTQEIFDKWPFYKNPSGFRLIDIDFSYLHPPGDGLLKRFDDQSALLSNFLFLNVKDHSIKQMLAKLEQPEELSENSRQAILCWAMHGYLVPTEKVVKKDISGKKSVKKFTIKDSQQAFVFVGNSAQKVEDYLNSLKSFKQNVQPFIYVLGEDISSISSIHVFFDDIKYNFVSFLRAVDICFKIFYVFELDFPKECCMFWTFLASHFFNLKCKKTYSNVHVLSEELQRANTTIL